MPAFKMIQPVPKQGDIIDIGGSQLFDDVGDRLAEALKADVTADNKPTLPDELLYTDVGLPIWNEIIFTPEFYQTHDEIALFGKYGPELVQKCTPGVTMIDLGAGDTRKVEHLLAAFEKARMPATYMALDISKASLGQNVAYLAAKHSEPDSVVKCVGLWGTFQDGRRFVQCIQTPRLFLSLGSVLCNDEWSTAVSHLKYWASALRPDDLLLIGMDGHLMPRNQDKMWAAYHSRSDLFGRFFDAGFKRSNHLLGEDWFSAEDWDFLAELETNPTTRHRFFWRAKRDVKIFSVGRTFKAGDEIDWFDSHKYGEVQVDTMCSKAKLTMLDVWQAPKSEFRQYLVKIKGDKEKADIDSAVSGVI